MPLRDYVTAFAAEYDTPFCLGRVLTAEPAPAELDMGMVANGLTELGRLVRDVAEGLRESGRQAQADQLARDFTESARVIAAGMERVGQDPEVERVRAVVGNSGGGQVMKTGDARHPMLAPSTRTGDFSKPINNAEQNQRNADFWKDQGRSSGDRTRDANAAKLKAQSQRR